MQRWFWYAGYYPGRCAGFGRIYTASAIIREKYEGEKVRDALEKNDQDRHNAHERAIMGVKRLNRFAGMKGLEPIFDGDVSNRYEVADFCCETVKEYFDNRIL